MTKSKAMKRYWRDIRKIIKTHTFPIHGPLPLSQARFMYRTCGIRFCETKITRNPSGWIRGH